MTGNRIADRTTNTAATLGTPLYATVFATSAAAGAVAVVAAAVVFAGAEPVQLARAALAAWVPLVALLATVRADPVRLGRFALVFAGTLVGLTLLVGWVVGEATLEAAVVELAGLRFAVGVRPTMAVLVGGALALAYYGVFRWDDGAPDGWTV